MERHEKPNMFEIEAIEENGEEKNSSLEEQCAPSDLHAVPAANPLQITEMTS